MPIPSRPGHVNTAALQLQDVAVSQNKGNLRKYPTHYNPIIGTSKALQSLLQGPPPKMVLLILGNPSVHRKSSLFWNQLSFVEVHDHLVDLCDVTLEVVGRPFQGPKPSVQDER